MGERLDQTINNICDWVDVQLAGANYMDESNILPVTISALAELITARAGILN